MLQRVELIIAIAAGAVVVFLIGYLVGRNAGMSKALKESYRAAQRSDPMIHPRARGHLDPVPRDPVPRDPGRRDLELMILDEERDAIRTALLDGRKIEAIKLYRQATGAGLKEAKDAVEHWHARGLGSEPGSWPEMPPGNLR